MRYLRTDRTTENLSTPSDTYLSEPPFNWERAKARLEKVTATISRYKVKNGKLKGSPAIEKALVPLPIKSILSGS